MTEPRRRLVLVSGPPAAGKSTLARRLADALGWPLLAKDDFKEALFDAIAGSAGDVAESRRLGDEALDALLAALSAHRDAVVDANVRAGSVHAEALRALAADVAEVNLDGDRALLAARYAARQRHPAHPPRVPEGFAAIDYGPVFPSRCLRLDASASHDGERVATEVLAMMTGTRPD